MHRALFGTDGIRGRAGQYPLDDTGALQVGKAIAAYFTKPGDLVLIGYDPRESSPQLAAAVTAGLIGMGVHVENLSVIPTPGLAYLTRQCDAVAGIMITASHNLYTDNGIKVFTGEGSKLSDDIEAGLNKLINSVIPERGTGQASTGSIRLADYENFLIASCEGTSLQTFSVALDTANGATSGIAARVFSKLGASVVPLFDQPDGRNINLHCGATDTTTIQEIVTKEAEVTVGAAFDGDGDRLVLIDEQGRPLSGDHLLYILAVTGGHSGVVATIMSNQGLEVALKKHGIALHRTAVGDRYVLAGLAQTGLTLGGEQSGHIILLQHAATGDGMLAALQIFKAVQDSGKNLAAWRDELELLPQRLVNISLTDKSLLQHPDVTAFIATQTTALGENGRISIRPSGTEPKARVMVEAADADERAPAVAQQLEDLLLALQEKLT